MSRFPREDYFRFEDWKTHYFAKATPLRDYLMPLKQQLISKKLSGIHAMGSYTDFAEPPISQVEPVRISTYEAIVLDFEGTHLDLWFWNSSSVKIGINSLTMRERSLDAEDWSDVSSIFHQIVNQPLKEIYLNATGGGFYDSLGLGWRSEEADCFSELIFVFENGFVLSAFGLLESMNLELYAPGAHYDIPEREPLPNSMFLLIGIPGSGKSTFYRRKLSKIYVRVNLDTLKTRHREEELIDACFAEGKSFCVDNTNLTRKERARYIEKANAHGWKIYGYFMKSVVKDCIARNEQREGDARLPAKAVAAMSNRMELPSRDEGFDDLYFVEIKGSHYAISEWREDK